jgi:hypothetical protein
LECATEPQEQQVEHALHNGPYVVSWWHQAYTLSASKTEYLREQIKNGKQAKATSTSDRDGCIKNPRGKNYIKPLGKATICPAPNQQSNTSSLIPDVAAY